MTVSTAYIDRANNAVLCAETMRTLAHWAYDVYDMHECPDGAYAFNIDLQLFNRVETVTVHCEYDEDMVSRYGVCTIYTSMLDDDRCLLSDKIETSTELKVFVDLLCTPLFNKFGHEHVQVL